MLGLDCFGVVEVELLLVVVELELEPELELEVEVEVEVELEEEEELEELGGELELVELLVVLVAGAVVVVAVELVELGWQDWLEEATPAPLTSELIAVPAGTLVKVSVWPVMRVTVIVHVSADATGRLAISDRSSAPASARTSHSFRLPLNVARFLPFAACPQNDDADDVATCEEATDWFGALQRGTVAVTGLLRH